MNFFMLTSLIKKKIFFKIKKLLIDLDFTLDRKF